MKYVVLFLLIIATELIANTISPAPNYHSYADFREDFITFTFCSIGFVWAKFS